MGHTSFFQWRRPCDRVGKATAAEDAHGIRVHRVSELDPRDIRRYQGIPITSPARALLEITPDLTDRQLERALDEALIHSA